jgi:hypothetical protein
MRFDLSGFRWRGGSAEPVCSLCGGAETYRVWDMLTYEALAQALTSKPEWFAVRDPIDSVPDLPAALAGRAKTTQLPGFASKQPPTASRNALEHRRCSQCHSLLPPQFWRLDDEASKGFALAVIGYAEVGKTTWLNGLLTEPKNEKFDVIRKSRDFITDSYDYAEPFTIDLLRDMRGLPKGTRTLTATLLGTTVKWGKRRVTVRTLDIRGEHLDQFEIATRNGITRHLTLRGEAAALLLVDRFETHDKTPAQLPIGELYQKLRMAAPSFWSGVVWTYLDTAKWSSEAAAWLQKGIGTESAPLIALAEKDPKIGVDLNLEWGTCIGAIDEQLTSALLQAISASSSITNYLNQSERSPASRGGGWFARLRGAIGDSPSTSEKKPSFTPGPPTAEVLDGLVALLFRLQIAYSLRAGDWGTGKAMFHENGGAAICRNIAEIARLLYILWDNRRGAMKNLLLEDRDFRVFPCGLVGGDGGVSVWSDLILLEAIRGTGVAER